MEKANLNQSDIIIVGGGPSGLACALEAERAGYSVVVVAPEDTVLQTDARTTALMVPAIQMLVRYGLWDILRPNAAALRFLRIIDDTKRIVKAPLVDFAASEIGEEAFGYNIPNQVLNRVLLNKVKQCTSIGIVEKQAVAFQSNDVSAEVELSDGAKLQAQLVIGADGVNSLVRQSAGIDVRKWAYPQTACVMAFDHERPHENRSTEFHTPFGPFTQVPLPGNRSSLVWVRTPEDARVMCALSSEDLCRVVEEQMQSMLGNLSNPTIVQAWPLSSLVAKKFSGKRVILIGQAAHAFPPIGAQGLNLGFRDIDDFGSALQLAHGDAGAKAVTDRYNTKRLADVYMRTGAVDVLNRSLLSGFVPLQMGRALGMSVLKSVPVIRNIFMREGIKPGSSLSGMFKR